MIKIRDLVRQLNTEDYNALVDSFEDSNNILLKGIIELYRDHIYSDEKMAEVLQINSYLYSELKRSLKRKIYALYDIDCNEIKHNLLNRVSYLSTRPSNFNCEEENLILHSLLNDLNKFNLDYYAASIYEKLTQLNRNNDKYEDYYKLYRSHYNIKQSNERCLTLFMHLNSKIGEFNQDPCNEFKAQIDRTLLELKNIFTYNKNGYTSSIYHLSILLVSAFLPESKYAFTSKETIETSYLTTSELIQQLPAGAEQFYLNNILALTGMKFLLEKITPNYEAAFISQINTAKHEVYYNLNFPTNIADDLITSYQQRYLNNQSFTPSKGLVISLQENLIKTKNAINYFAKNRDLNPLTNRSTAFS